jgi:cellobiose phosphorylase
MYQAAIEALLGLRRQGSTFSVSPSIPAMWPTYSLEWIVGRTRYRIVVSNPEHRCRGVESATLDGDPVDAGAIPLTEDGQTHDVAIVLGRGSRRTAENPMSRAAFR